MIWYIISDDDHCTNNPCLNNAECRRISGGFTCNPCPLNVTGALCEFGMYIQSIHCLMVTWTRFLTISLTVK